MILAKRILYLRHMEVIETKTAVFSMLNEVTLKVVMKEDAVVDEPEAIENYEAAVKLTKGKRHAVFVDARHYATLTDEAREFSSAPEQHEQVIAQAIVINSLASRLLANFLIQFYKRVKRVEMHLFNDCEEAMTWLNKMISEEEKHSSAKINKAEKSLDSVS